MRYDLNQINGGKGKNKTKQKQKAIHDLFKCIEDNVTRRVI